METNNRECFVGNQKVDCLRSDNQSLIITGDKLDLLPQITTLEKRSDPLFFTLLLIVFFSLLVLALFKIKIFGKTLIEYIRPIWYFILISIAVVLWQYLFGLKINDNLMALRISQWIWEICVAASAYKLIKTANFGYGNLLFLGIIYSLIIHGLKVSIRYLFYDKTLLYVVDRFLYGSLLVMAIVFVAGSILVFLRRRGVMKF